jgi:prolipoprotein diacylglyceryltransferase
MAILGGAIGFCIGVKLYFNAEHEKTMETFSQYIKKRKLQAQKRKLS